jgi:NDP-hexose 2,3-enoyl reductase
MEYTHLGRSGLSVSRLCLGTMNFGPQADEPTSHTIMDAALDAGLNFFDTANVYGWKKGEGYTEQIVGRWFAQGGGRREKVVIATKLYGSMSDWPNDTFLSARNIRHACEGSLRRLQTDHIDLYQMHHVDRNTPFDEIWEAMEVLVQQGKVLYVGSSNFAGWTIAQAQETARARHFLGLVSEQCLFNLVQRHAEEEVIPAAQQYGVGIIAWSPLMRGLLGGILAKQGDTGRSASEQTQSLLEEHRGQIEAYEAFCAKLGEHPSTVGLAWLLRQPGLTAPIIGPRTVEQFQSNLHALDVQLDDAALEELDAMFPGPGPAPEAWAW